MPGGRREVTDRDIEATLEREVDEETGLSLIRIVADVAIQRFPDQGQHIVRRYVIGEAIGGLSLGPEHDSLTLLPKITAALDLGGLDPYLNKVVEDLAQQNFPH